MSGQTRATYWKYVLQGWIVISLGNRISICHILMVKLWWNCLCASFRQPTVCWCIVCVNRWGLLKELVWVFLQREMWWLYWFRTKKRSHSLLLSEKSRHKEGFNSCFLNWKKRLDWNRVNVQTVSVLLSESSLAYRISLFLTPESSSFVFLILVFPFIDYFLILKTWTECWQSAGANEQVAESCCPPDQCPTVEQGEA